jgi:hypothetical protein
MNENIYRDNSWSDVLWLTSDRRARGRDTTRNTIDRLEEGAAPAGQHLGESASAVEGALRARTDHLRDTRDDWVESVRTTVRGNPLVAIAAAVTLGAVIARVAQK